MAMTAFSIFKQKKVSQDSSKNTSASPKVAVQSEKKHKLPEQNIKSSKEERRSVIFLEGGKEENLLLRPHFSEKTTNIEKERKYVFLVVPQANKKDIKKAVENIYKVHVTKVNMSKTFTRSKRWGTKKTNFQKTKKAIVTIQEGQKIELGI